MNLKKHLEITVLKKINKQINMLIKNKRNNLN